MQRKERERAGKEAAGQCSAETVQRILANPAHIGPLENATHTGTAGVKGEGAYMQIWLEIRGEIERGRADAPSSADSPSDGNKDHFAEWMSVVRRCYRRRRFDLRLPLGNRLRQRLICTLITGREVERAKLITAADLLLARLRLRPTRCICVATWFERIDAGSDNKVREAIRN